MQISARTPSAAEVQRLWLEGKREDAVLRVPHEMVVQSSLLIGDGGSSPLATLGRAVELVREVSSVS